MPEDEAWPTPVPAPAPAPAEDSVDAGFARDMAVHHQQAVELSFIVRDRTDDADVRRLAYDIINTQANQRGMLLGRLDAWDLPTISEEPPMAWMDHAMSHEPHDGSLMPGMATNTELDRLRRAEGEAAEVRYLQLMTAHHQGGVHMAEAAANQAEDPTIARLAEGMVSGQQSEIDLMADMLTERGAEPLP
ncbi:DUF305 domain-containing protein [Streptomyces sp. B6B3]|uniref:DUF305 domain-containing protein n=1 Tax=Streptomyces sp. B6B3 TaxID=3153570 RepID=UPI00325D602E